jgi:hypothetical protein
LSIEWQCIQLGLPFQQSYDVFPASIGGFRERTRPYNFLRYSTDASLIPEIALAEEFTKEHVRVTFRSMNLSELSHIGGIFWGSKFTCPLEISEQAAANDRLLGKFFTLGFGPFLTLTLLGANRRNLNSLFIVGEVDSLKSGLVAWWFTTFEQTAQFATSANREEGRHGPDKVINIPKGEFQPLSKAALSSL